MMDVDVPQEYIRLLTFVGLLAAVAVMIDDLVDRVKWQLESSDPQSDKVVLEENALQHLESGGQVRRYRWHGEDIILEAADEKDSVKEVIDAESEV